MPCSQTYFMLTVLTAIDRLTTISDLESPFDKTRPSPEAVDKSILSGATTSATVRSRQEEAVRLLLLWLGARIQGAAAYVMRVQGEEYEQTAVSYPYNFYDYLLFLTHRPRIIVQLLAFPRVTPADARIFICKRSMIYNHSSALFFYGVTMWTPCHSTNSCECMVVSRNIGCISSGSICW